MQQGEEYSGDDENEEAEEEEVDLNDLVWVSSVRSRRRRQELADIQRRSCLSLL